MLVPEVVLHELSRQWTKYLTDAARHFDAASTEVNSIVVDANVATITPSTAPSMGRSAFYGAAAIMLTRKGVEVARYPDVPARRSARSRSRRTQALHIGWLGIPRRPDLGDREVDLHRRYRRMPEPILIYESDAGMYFRCPE